MKNRLKNINFYLTSIDIGSGIDNLVDSGTFVIKDTTVNGFSLTNGAQIFFVIIDADQTLKREIFRITNVDIATNTFTFDKRISPNGKQTHAENALVQINDVAETFNYLSLHTEDAGYTEVLTGRNVKVAGGIFRYGALNSYVVDTTLIMDPNTTNYIILDFADGVVKSTTSTTGMQYYLFATAVTNGTDVLSLVDGRATFVGFDTDVITPSITIGNTTTLVEGSVATVTNAGTALEPIFNFGIPTGATGAIGNPGPEGQQISENTTLKSGWAVEIVGGNSVKITQDSGLYTMYTTSGITSYSVGDEILASQAIVGTFETPVMTYSDGMAVNGTTGLISFTGHPAYVDKDNTFVGVTTFNGPVMFNSDVTFPPATMDVVTNNIIFDGSKSRKQVVTLVDTNPKTISFVNMKTWGNFEFAIITTGATTLSKGTVSASGSIVNISTLRDPTTPATDWLPLVMTGPDVYIFVGDVYNTAVHLSVSGVSRSV